MTRDELTDAVRKLYGEASTTHTDDLTIHNWLNRAIEELLGDAGAEEKLATFMSVPGQQEYGGADVGFPIDFMRPLAVYYDGLKLRHIDFREIVDASPDLQGTPLGYYLRLNPVKLGFHPIPADAKEIRLFYQASPTLMAAGTDEPAIPAPYHYALAYWAAAQWALADENIQRASAFMLQFERRKLELLGAGMSRTAETYPTVRWTGD
ncbi:MAG TPA: hypothetical protein VF226_04825 [Hyphomicrobiaceae bacterium]